MFKNLSLFILFGVIFVFFSRCTENSIALYIDIPETLKKGKIASFYGSQARKNCETYRRFYSGLCDTTSQPFITCYDINEKKYKSSSCE